MGTRKICLIATMISYILLAGVSPAAPANGDIKSESIYSQRILKGMKAILGEQPEIQLHETNWAQVTAFFQIDADGRIVYGPNVVVLGDKGGSLALASTVRQAIRNAAPFRNAPNHDFVGRILRISVNSCSPSHHGRCPLEWVEMPASVKAWPSQKKKSLGRPL